MMSDYYDSDDDVVLVRQESSDGRVLRAKSARGKEASGSRYGTWDQSELERHVFSWRLQDVLDRNLLNKKVIFFQIFILSLPVFFFNHN
jgi:hypothetical protein